MKINKNHLFNLLLIFTLSSCSSNLNTMNNENIHQYDTTNNKTYETNDESTPVNESLDSSTDEVEDKQISKDIDYSDISSDRKIENIFDYTFESINYDQDYDKLTKLVDDHKGYIESSNLNIDTGRNGDENIRNFGASIKIPQEESNKFKNEIAKIGKIIYQSSYTNDLTSSYKDINIRLSSKEKELDKLNDLMKNAKNIDETMAIQARILEVEEEIDQIKSMIKDVDSKVTYDTFDININEVYDYNNYANNNPDFSSRIKEAFKDSIHIFSKFWQDLLVAIVSIWPLILVAIIIIYIIKKSKEKKLSNGEE
ncbi:MAG: DUF4349 domain-containing protein [Anaerococcus sp.]|uniref:DUF4349 domain-containing protein n=1 Tax=Anaerococcus sp. TaxID=1872515 RepID=UPI0029002D9C|nr:DUF4349 domain-containing protein [Anaerococcus sp.]MDU2353288.1 DUF4349 domain-containing protein [Anaerococcus sp.]MDU2565381.1 DUF4349 domain-containing protein [Anaerococcus sp.]